jgi:hypothetical protein
MECSEVVSCDSDAVSVTIETAKESIEGANTDYCRQV